MKHESTFKLSSYKYGLYRVATNLKLPGDGIPVNDCGHLTPNWQGYRKPFLYRAPLRVRTGCPRPAPTNSTAFRLAWLAPSTGATLGETRPAPPEQQPCSSIPKHREGVVDLE